MVVVFSKNVSVFSITCAEECLLFFYAYHRRVFNLLFVTNTHYINKPKRKQGNIKNKLVVN